MYYKEYTFQFSLELKFKWKLKKTPTSLFF